MRMDSHWSVLSIFHLLSFLCLVITQDQSDLIQTTLGTVKGLRKEINGKSVDVYYGIPFAKPPVGDLRFKHPVQADPWTGVKDAVTMPNSCVQSTDTAFGRFKGVEMWNPTTPVSEDCLYLNVWIPRGLENLNPRPTLIWIYGGGFTTGSSTLEVYNGEKLAVAKNVIVVTLNYRVGPLGFLSTGTERAPGNQGLLDQAMALRWVYDNIENLGGSRDQMTIFGESAGAVSVGYHLLSPISQSYFSRAIMQSGSPFLFKTLQFGHDQRRKVQRLSSELGCPVLPESVMMNCLQTTDAQRLTDLAGALTNGYFGSFFLPVIDNYFLPGQPRDLVANGAIKKTEIIIGANLDEGTYFLLYGFPDDFPLDNSGELNRTEFESVVQQLTFSDSSQLRSALLQEYVDSYVPSQLPSYRDIADEISGDDLFKCPVVDFATEFAKYGDVYMYSFEYRVTNNPWPEWTGVLHGYEIDPVFALPESFNYSQQDLALTERVTDFWTRFAEYGDPNGNGAIQWPKMSVERLEYLRITGDGDTVEYGYRQRECSFFRTIIPLLRNSTC